MPESTSVEGDVGQSRFRLGECPNSRVARFLSWAEQRSDRLIVLLCAGLMLVGLAYSLHLGSDLAFSDERDYVAIADNLIDKGMFSVDGERPTAARPPAWPLLLAGLRFLGLPIVLLRMVNVVLFATCVYLLYLILSRAWSPVVGIAGGTLALGYGLFFYTAETLYPQMLEAALLLLLVYVLFDSVVPGPARRVTAGVAAGVLVLTTPRWILLLPFVLAMVPGPRRARAVTALVTIVVALPIVGAWTVRNLVTFDRVILVSSNIGGNLLVGNSDDFAAEVRKAEGLDEAEADRRFTSSALRWIVDNPRLAATLYLERVVEYFAFRNELATRSQSSVGKDILLALSYGLLILLALGRLILRKHLPLVRLDLALIALYFASALVAALAAPRIRYRVPFDFLLVALGAPIIAAVLGRMRRVTVAVTGTARRLAGEGVKQGSDGS